MRAGLGPLAALLFLSSGAPVLAQVNLPPPPPPPIDNSGGSSGSSGSGDNTPTQPHKPKPHKPVEPAHTAAPQPTTPPAPPPHHENPEPPPPRPVEYETPRTTSIRLNPLPFFVSRVSADLEFMLAPHHALVVSPSITFHKFAFHRSDIITYGMGYAADDSAGFGGEVGYHYWIRRHLQGIYLGPSLVLGATIPSVPATAKAFAYVGGAFDVGYQYLFANGFTLNGGGGIMVTGASGTTAHAAPRFLFGLGWSF